MRVRRGSRRLTVAMQDFLLDPAERLTEQERALMTGMLHGLVKRLADEVRVRLPAGLAVASECDPALVVAELARSGLLARPELFALLLRRTDTVRIAEAAGPAASGQAGQLLLQQWAADKDEGVAGAAMAVVLGRAAARDRFGRLALELADCPADVAVDLTYGVAAALARRCGQGSAEELVAAGVDVLARHDEGQRLEALEARLVLALDQAGRLDSAAIQALANAGEVCLLAEALARLARIPGESAWPLLADPGDGRLALLLRMAGQPRALVANLFVRLAIPLGLRDPAREIESFDRIAEAQADSARTSFRLPPAYLAAATALDEHGQPIA